MSKYFRFPFANQGDRVAVPDETQADGQVSYNQGYGPDYQRTPGTDPQARRIERNRFNQLLNDITSTLQIYYQEGVPPFITAANNGGNAFAYPQYARVRYDSGSGDRIYESLINNNTNLPTVTTAWRLVDFTGLDDRYGLGSTTPLRTGTAAGNIPLIGTPGTTAAGANSAVVVRSGSNANGRYEVFSNGFIIQYGTVVSTVDMVESYPLPIPYQGSDFRIFAADNIGQVGTTPRNITDIGIFANSSNSFRAGSTSFNDFFQWMSIGF